MFNSPKTTAAAVLALLSVIMAGLQLYLGRIDPDAAWSIILAGLSALGIGAFAKDADAAPPGPPSQA